METEAIWAFIREAQNTGYEKGSCGAAAAELAALEGQIRRFENGCRDDVSQSPGFYGYGIGLVATGSTRRKALLLLGGEKE